MINMIISFLKKWLNIKLGFTREQKVFLQNEIDEKNKLLEIFFSNLKKMGFNPKHIIDVGANRGTWTRETMRYFPESYYTLIEPQHWLSCFFNDILESNSKVNYIPTGAGSKSGSFLFTILDRDDSCSFRYTKEEASAAGYKQHEIQIKTLNEIVYNSRDLPFPDLIKIDAEGLDIDVLDGATDLFGKTEIFLVEASVFNKGFKNDFLTVTDYMDKKGYKLFEITDMNRPFTHKVLWLVELVFIRKNGYIDSFSIDTNNL